MASAPFWIALICQLIIVLGYFWFYRKEQLGKATWIVPLPYKWLIRVSQHDRSRDLMHINRTFTTGHTRQTNKLSWTWLLFLLKNRCVIRFALCLYMDMIIN